MATGPALAARSSAPSLVVLAAPLPRRRLRRRRPLRPQLLALPRLPAAARSRVREPSAGRCSTSRSRARRSAAAARTSTSTYRPATHGTRSARYPVLYLLHGFPGRPLAFLLTVRMGVVEDELVAKHRAQPLILVMPFGSTGTFTDKEWANGTGPAEDGERSSRATSCTRSTRATGRSRRVTAARSAACRRAATARSTSRCSTRASSRSRRAGRATSGRRAQPFDLRAAARRSSSATPRSTGYAPWRGLCAAHTTSGSTPGPTTRCARRTSIRASPCEGARRAPLPRARRRPQLGAVARDGVARRTSSRHGGWRMR